MVLSMRNKKFLALMASAVLAISACGGGGSDGPAPAPTIEETASEPEPTEEPEPEAETATVQQWASKIAEVEGGVRESVQDWEEEDCLPVDLASGNWFCGMNMRGMSTNAQIVVLTIQGGTKEGVPAYIGEPPAEIATLVTETLDAAIDAEDATAAAIESCDASADDCHVKAVNAVIAMGQLERKLDAWKPYL